MLGRGSGFILGLLGLILPGYLFFITYEFTGKLTGTTTLLHTQGFFYTFVYTRSSPGSTGNELSWISRNWFQSETWGGTTPFYLYLACFAVTVFAFIAYIGNDGFGSFLFLMAGILNLAFLIVMYSNMDALFHLADFSGYPIPVGSIFLLLAGLIGRKD